MDEIEELLEVNPEASAYYAIREMHYGRLAWLAEHIRRCNHQIDQTVARKILAMLEGGDADCQFRLQAVRRPDLPPRAVDPTLQLHRDADMALEVARKCGFKRGHLDKACFELSKSYGLSAEYVKKRVRPFRAVALNAIAEEKGAEAYQRGETDFLGRPKHP